MRDKCEAVLASMCESRRFLGPLKRHPASLNVHGTDNDLHSSRKCASSSPRGSGLASHFCGHGTGDRGHVDA